MKVIQGTENIVQFEEIDIPTGLINYLEKKTQRTTYITKSRYSVTDIVGCQRKSHYKAIGFEEEDLLNDATVENMCDSIRGDLLHQITYAYRWREMDIEHYVPLKDGKVATIAGRLDMYDWKTATIIDLKTTKFVKWQIKQGFIPKAEHILQLQCYGTMFSKVFQVENLNIIYVDMNDIVTYKICTRDLTQWINARIQELEDSIAKKEVPLGDVSGLCKYCRYQTRCYSDRGGLITKPLSKPKSV